MSRLPFPDAVIAQHGVVLGKTGSGKSSKLRVIVEDLLAYHEPVTIIDPKGDWWGLKSSRDGKSAGFPVVIFGGEHADVPINRQSGAAVAELVSTGNRPAIIDLGGWMPGDRTRFFIDFASTVFRTTRGGRYLVIDEVHNFAPKGKVFDPDAGRMLHWANRLASEGRGKGLTILAASQRPQKVHNDFLTSCETLIACRVIHAADRNAIKEWIAGSADPVIGKAVLDGLAQMKREEAWVWSPECGYGPEKLKFPMFQTYDSFKPQPAAGGKLKGWAAVDLDEVRGKLAAALEEAKANDPAALKREIAELRKTVLTVPADPELIHAAEVRGYKRGLDAYGPWVSGLRDRLIVAMNQSAKDVFAALDLELNRQPVAPPVREPAYREIVEAMQRKPKHIDPPKLVEPVSGIELNGVKIRILNAIAWLNAKGIERPSHEAVAAVANTKPSGGYFRNAMGAMRTAGLIDYPTAGAVVLTEGGEKLATVESGGSLEDSWLGILSGIDRKIVEALLRYHPEPQSRADLATEIHTESEGGYFRNALGRVRTLGAIDYPRPGYVALTRHVKP